MAAAAAEARDRILIFEDTDGDHVLNSRKVFAEGLNLASGIAVGFGGVWVGAAPDFIFSSNPWGVDFDDLGHALQTACVIQHLYHVIPGARYQRQAGQHFNPYTLDDIKTIARHRHWAGNQRATGRSWICSVTATTGLASSRACRRKISSPSSSF